MKKKYLIGVWIDVAIVAVGLVATIMSLFSGQQYVYYKVANLIVYALVIYYALWGYKKPHGNLLKYLMLFFALTLIFRLNIHLKFQAIASATLLPEAMVLIGFVAGRLDHIKTNKYIMVLILLMLAHCSISSIIANGGHGFVIDHAMMSPLFIWITLSGAYFLRYAEHKEAGLQDK